MKMIFEEIKNIKSVKNELRKFGIIMGIIFGLLGGFLLWREKAFYLYFLTLSSAFLIAGIGIPILLKPIYKIWMTLAILLSWFMIRIILGILFYLVFTSIGLSARLFGKDFLELEFNKSLDSYWILKKDIKLESAEYERQF